MVEGLKGPLSGQLKFCDTCAQGKPATKPFTGTRPRATQPLEHVHSNVCGPIMPISTDGYRYFVTFIDDYTHLVAVYLMKHKSETFDRFKSFHAMATNQQGRPMCRLRCDNGDEYISGQFKQFCKDKGIVLEYTPPFTPHTGNNIWRFQTY